MKKIRMRTLLGALAVGTIVPATALAAFDMFLKLDNIPGESLSKAHSKEIEIQAWSWGMDRPGVTGMTGAAITSTLGRPCFSELALTKRLDSASPKLMGALTSGTVIAKARLTLTKAGSEIPVDYFTIDMASVLVSSMQEAGSSGEDVSMENLSLRFASATATYTPVDPLGKAGTPIPVVIKTPPC